MNTIFHLHKLWCFFCVGKCFIIYAGEWFFVIVLLVVSYLSFQVWAALVATLIVCTFVLYLITHSLPCKSGVRRSYNIWFLLRTFGQQGKSDLSPLARWISYSILSIICQKMNYCNTGWHKLISQKNYLYMQCKRVKQGKNVAIFSYSTSFSFVNQFLPYVCQHLPVDWSNCSVNLFQFWNEFWKWCTVNLIFN